MSIYQIKDAVESFAPSSNAESWDNTGVLIDAGPNEGTRILLTIDLTDEVVLEALRRKVSHIVAYHPVIFRPIKSITEDRLVRCLQNRISVYSPHTQLDPLMNKYVLETIVGEKPGTIDKIARRLADVSKSLAFRVVYGGAQNKEYRNDGDIRVGVGAAFRGIDVKDSLLITGEMAHHDLLRCKRNRTSVILMEHSVSERVFMAELRSLLLQTKMLEGYEILISEEDRDPVEYFVL